LSKGERPKAGTTRQPGKRREKKGGVAKGGANGGQGKAKQLDN